MSHWIEDQQQYNEKISILEISYSIYKNLVFNERILRSQFGMTQHLLNHDGDIDHFQGKIHLNLIA